MRKKLMTLGIFMALLGLSAVVQATTITYTDFVKFSGSGSGTPDVTATIEDFGANTVKITMFGPGLLSSDKITEWYFNVTLPGLTSGDFTNIGAQTGGVAVAYDDNKADGDGKYDILFTFPTSGDTFIGTDQSVWQVTKNELDALDFADLAFPAGGLGPYYSAVKLGNAYWGTETNPAPEPIPEPGMLVLLSAGLLGLWAVRRRK